MSMIFDHDEALKYKTALYDADGTSMTYGDLALYEKKIKRVVNARSVVMVISDSCLETVSFYYSLLHISAVPLLVSYKADVDYIRYLNETYRPGYVWFPSERESEIEDVISGSSIMKEERHTLYSTKWDSYSIHSDLALLLTTSGSTGNSKLVRLSYKNLESNADLTIKAFGIESSDLGITILPIHHCYGLNLLHVCWRVGAGVCLYNETIINPSFSKVISDLKPTLTYAVPYSLELLKYIDYKAVFSSIKKLVIAGEKMNDEQAEFVREMSRKYSLKLILAYGQTEGTTMLSWHDGKKVIDTRCIGRVLPGLDAHISSPSDDGIGEIVFNGDSAALGYAEDYKDLCRGDDFGGELFTGDMGFMDNEGYIFISGRKKRIVKIHGERISLDDIELILHKKWPESEFACTGQTDQLDVLYSGKELKEEDLKNYVYSHAGIYMNMIDVMKLNSIPRTASGKVAYNELENTVWKS